MLSGVVGGLDAIFTFGFRENPGNVAGNCVRGYEKPLGDVGVRQAFRN